MDGCHKGVESFNRSETGQIKTLFSKVFTDLTSFFLSIYFQDKDALYSPKGLVIYLAFKRLGIITQINL